MRWSRWQMVLGGSLLLASVAIYALQVVAFHDERNTLFYLLQDLAFLPAQVLLVSLVLNAVITRRERAERLRQMNMVIGVFFSEVGTALLRHLAAFDRRGHALHPHLRVDRGWTHADFARALAQVRAHAGEMRCEAGDLPALKALLLARRDVVLRLLENPNLLEHETFTELLWAVSHLTDELWYRPAVDVLDPADAAHLAGDLQRAHGLLLAEWLAYVEHLRDEYPYILSLVMRANPFDPAAEITVGEERAPASVG